MFERIEVGGRGGAEAVVVGVFQDGDRAAALDRAVRALDAEGVIEAARRRGECTGALGSVCEAFPAKGRPAGRVVLVGLGAKESFGVEQLRVAVAAAGRRLAHARAGSVEFALDGAARAARIKPAAASCAIGESMALLGYRYTHFKGATASSRPPSRLTIRARDAEARAALRRGAAIGESANLARSYAATPPNVATPMWMAEQARRMAATVSGLRVEVIEGDALEAHGLVGIATVGQASENPPCLIRVEYRPAGGGRGKPAVIIGKTVTYDTGGLSIKPSNFMRGMKGDKAGGCAVLAAMHAIAKTVKPSRRVVALLAAAENSISDDAYRPDDVLCFRNGVTVEVTNTDAEGRLVLADALAWACDNEDPAYVVDLATLTGGVVTALGSTYAGLWCEDDALRKRVEIAAEVSGERVWRLPCHQEHLDLMKSDIADILNSSASRKAHPIQGAAFLSYFVKKGVPWCHLDIAGVADTDTDSGPFVRNAPTGWGVRLLAELVGL